MKVEFVVNAEHRGTVDQFLSGSPVRIRICALNIHDVRLIRTSLRPQLIRLLNLGCEVMIAFGESLWNRDTWEPKDESCAQIIDFLKELRSNGARVWYVPRLHAKILYVEESAMEGRQPLHTLIGSANFTESALGGHSLEMGAVFRDLDSYTQLAQRVRNFTGGLTGVGRSLEDVVQEV